MSELDSKRRAFEDRLDSLAGKHFPVAANGADGGTGSENGLSPDLQERLREWEASLDRRLEEFRGGETAPSPAGPKAVEQASQQIYARPLAALAARKGYRSDAAVTEWFHDTETMLLDELEWGRHPRPTGFQDGFESMPSEEAMQVAIAQACGLRQVPVDVHWKEYQLGVFHVPGRGTLINPSHYVHLTGSGGQKAGDPYAMAVAVSDMAMERWGWGFLLEYTALGNKAGAAGLWPAMLADRAGLPIPDPQAREMALAIRRKWTLLKHGWQDWIWQYVMFKSRHPLGKLVDRPRPGRVFELLMRLQDLFTLVTPIFGVPIRLRNLADLVKFLFLEQTNISPKVLNQVITWFQGLCIDNDERVKQLVDMPLSRLIGRLYFSWLENQVGILTTPYAMLIAAYEPQVDLAGLSSAAEFLGYVEKEPRHNPDARLAMLTRLDPRVKYNPRAMYTAAWERLKLEGPREYFGE